MKHRGTFTQFFSYLGKVYAAKDTTHDCLTVYFDVKKAFDSVSHGLLLHKLSSFGFDHNLIKLFQLYLTCQKQVGKVDGCFSSEAVVTSGVPQGSVLGPLLFIIFINDVTDSIQHCEYFLYCDDLKLFSVSSIDKIQNDIDSLSSWSFLNELDFHPDKCKILSLSQRYNNAELSLSGSHLKHVDSIVDLGITVSSSLCLDNHVNLSIAKTTKVLNFLKRSVPIGVYVSRRKFLYKSMASSILEYGSAAWYPSISALQKLEKLCLKWVLNCKKSYLESLIVLNILPVSLQLIRTDLLLLWKLLNGFIDSHLNAILCHLDVKFSSHWTF